MGLNNPSASGATTFAALTDAKVVRKSADETVNNSTTLQNDDELLFAVGANEVWAFTIYLLLSTHGTPDIKVTVTMPTGGNYYCVGIGFSGAEAAQTITFNSNDVDAAQVIFGGSGAANIRAAIIKGVVINGGTAGNCQLQWAQANANASDTKVRANSFIIAHKVA